MRDFSKHPRRPRTTTLRRLFRLAVFVFIFGAAGAGAFAALTLRSLPSPDEFFARRVVQSTKIYDRSGSVLLYEVRGEERRTVVPFGEIPAAVKNATVAAEDANFYRHAGVDLRGILRAFLTDLITRDFRQGGSTITQQLVKNALLGRERTITRKLREAVYAIALESRLPKDDILNLYLNQIPYGSNAYGVEAAAQIYFGKHARDLTLRESSLLAALPVAPSYYSPYGPHRDELLRRADYILGRMAELGYVSASESAAARSDKLALLPAAKNIRAPHFVMLVRDYLAARYGEEEVESGGLVVTTTLDWGLQEKAEEIVRDYAEQNERTIKSANMALVALDPKTGQILALVGSRGWTSAGLEDPLPAGCTPGKNCRLDPYVNAAISLRQPGSAFKPFVYATAFAKGLQPETALFDVPTEFNPACPADGSGVAPPCYHPGNYDESFRGPVTLRQALAQSLNVPSVKVLYLAGINDSIATAQAAGITTLTAPDRYGLSLVLGGAEVKLLELTSAYGVLAADGVKNAPTPVLAVKDASGQTLEEFKGQAQPAVDPEIARLVSDVLSDNEARIPLFQPRSSLYFEGRRVAAKTGTTQDFRDAWTVGYTPAIVVGVWAGNNDNSEIRQKGSGVLAAAPAWHAFMEFALAAFPPEELPIPAPRDVTKPVLAGVWQGDSVIAVDSVSGKRATDLTPPETRRLVGFGTPHDPLYWIDRADITGPPPADPSSDPQYRNWEAAFGRWLASSGFQPRNPSSAPAGTDDVHIPEKRPRLTVEKKSQSADALTLEVAVDAPFGLREVSLLSGERVLESRRQPSSPLYFSLPLSGTAAPSGAVEVRAYDLVGNIGSAIVPLP
ncbi:MAG: transglycosylase domain-containing protein [Candidatus Sungbacteria bacterium]|uniref:Transglycosylase domain-containing protein n=1 Tax=Candidatus Sungiibacteriota bacterium TaxID=2750080 RepID=A0A932YXR8_9BACT|nr:transglycosylase domain-containing protein [Candidatus Sungbacteria bacterium]